MRILFSLFAVCMVGACAAPLEEQTADADKYANFNRKVHALNLGIDTKALRPASRGYGAVVPGPVQTGLSNVADTLSLPGDVVNNLLQGRISDASHNTARLIVNATFGLGGLIDLAGMSGAHGAPTDFGETLYVWGLPEGRYHELPLAGPSTTRHAVGRIVDSVLDPIGTLNAPAPQIKRITTVADVLGKRDQNGELIDELLYQSVDSYEQARSLYLQNRRFELRRRSGAQTEYFDPYEDPYGPLE